MYRDILSVLIGYLFGSISSSVLISKGIYRIDVRTRGSGNAGATNVARVFGMASGLLTFGCDMLKTVLAMLLGRFLGGTLGMYLAGAACLIGHCFPVFFHFKGGKGVTVGAAIALMMDWRVFLSLVAVFLLVVLATKLVSLGSVIVAFLLPISCILMKEPWEACLLTACAAILVIVQHRGNIKRILRGEEPKFSPGKKP